MNLKYLISSALISTSLFAAENSVNDAATLSLDEAATRIQRRFRLPLDKKLHGIKDELSPEAALVHWTLGAPYQGEEFAATEHAEEWFFLRDKLLGPPLKS